MKHQDQDPDGELLGRVVQVLVIAAIFVSWFSAIYAIAEAP